MRSLFTALVLSSIGLAPAVFAQTSPTFTSGPGSPITVGGSPLSVAIGDFNSDGIPDLVTTNSTSNNVAVLLGNGSGGFTQSSGSPFTVGAYPDSVVVGDFNRDGHQDLAIANGGPSSGRTLTGGSLTILLGNGSGGFTTAPGSPISFGSTPAVLIAADFNEDGVPDLMSLNSVNSSVSILLGNGSGGFTPKGNPAGLAVAAVSAAVADFNRDGHLDVAVPGMSGVTILFGNGAGGFTNGSGTPAATNTAVSLLAAADFNGDGIQDLATATTTNSNISTVTILVGNGSGGFTAGNPVPAGSALSALIVSDINGDGLQDVAGTNQLSGGVSILLGNSSGGLTAATGNPYSAGSSPSSVIVGDFNGDGAADLAATNSNSSTITVLLGKGTGSPVPVIKQGGIVPVYSTATTIQPGEWVSIYGTNLASSTTTWNGNFPTSLGGTSVTIDGKPAYLWFVSSTQINLQVPDDATSGPVAVVVKTASGTATSTVSLAAFAPSFVLLDAKHVTGIILRSNGSGAYGGGTYDIIGPTGNSLGYPTVAAVAGDSVVLFAVGMGPTNPPVPAGKVYSSAAPITASASLLVNKISVLPSFVGISSAGLYQINLTVPAGLGTGDLSLQATVGGVQTQAGVVMSLQ